MVQFIFSINQGWSSRWISRCLITILGLTIFLGVIWTPAATAASATTQPATELKVSLGNRANELKFFPSNLEFAAGKRYKLLLDNPSPQKHYFTAKDFADVSWTQKVQAGKVEVKGAIHELELQPGGEAEWVFVPMKPGNYELHCSIKGHTELGMVGTIAIN
ncbi:MAG: copper-binding protein [Symploca sp. SIO2E6]|nr:copper-binding protein [Symploca sp. SIO2E6]